MTITRRNDAGRWDDVSAEFGLANEAIAGAAVASQVGPAAEGEQDGGACADRRGPGCGGVHAAHPEELLFEQGNLGRGRSPTVTRAHPQARQLGNRRLSLW